MLLNDNSMTTAPSTETHSQFTHTHTHRNSSPVQQLLLKKAGFGDRRNGAEEEGSDELPGSFWEFSVLAREVLLVVLSSEVGNVEENQVEFGAVQQAG